MGTLPTLTVLLDDGSGTFPFDISSYVKGGPGYQITKGRTDWQGAVTAGELTLTLDNSDGRFTPGSTILATPSPIVVDAQIRVTESIGASGFGLGGFGLGGFGTGGSFGRFTGYVKSWPVAWPATVTTFSTVEITATDAQARTERRTLRSMLQEEYVLDKPTVFYTLGEAQGSTSAGDTSGNQASSLAIAGTGTAPVFGVTTGLPDGSTGVSFSGGQFLRAPGTFVGTGAFTIECTYQRTNATAPTGLGPDESIIWVGGETFTPFYNVGLADDGSGFVHFLFFSNIVTPSNRYGTVNVCDGDEHDIAVTYDGAVTMQVYIDGIAVGGAVGGTVTAPTVACTKVQIGGGNAPLTNGVVSNVVITNGVALSPARLAQHASVALGSSESANARVARLASYAGISTGTLDSSLTMVQTVDTTGQSAWDALQQVADAELGLVFFDSSGALTFHNRNRIAAKQTPDLSISSQYVTPDATPTVDDQQIVNYIEATSVGTGTTSIAQDQGSEDAHGRYPESVTYLVTNDQQALDRANWTLANFAEPTPRFGTLTINLFKMNVTDAQTILSGLDLDCWLRVNSMASQTPGGATVDVVVEGWQENVDNESWSITCNVVARSLWNAFIADDPVHGIADSALAPAYV